MTTLTQTEMGERLDQAETRLLIEAGDAVEKTELLRN